MINSRQQAACNAVLHCMQGYPVWNARLSCAVCRAILLQSISCSRPVKQRTTSLCPREHAKFVQGNNNSKLSGYALTKHKGSRAPFQHVAQVDDKSARHRLHTLPLALCVDLEPRTRICCQHRQYAVVCVCASTIYTLHHLAMFKLSNVLRQYQVKTGACQVVRDHMFRMPQPSMLSHTHEFSLHKLQHGSHASSVSSWG